MAQVLINALIAGAIYALVAAGFSLVYRTHRFFYIAHGGVVSVGAFAFWIATRYSGSFFLAIPFALGLTIVVALVNDILIHTPLRKRNNSRLPLFLASTASYFLAENLLLLTFGPDVQTLPVAAQPIFQVGDASITLTNIVAFCACLVFCGGLYAVLKWTKIGRQVRAVADNEILAQVYGINVTSTYRWSIILSAVLAGVAGIAIALNMDVRFNMGMSPLLKGIAASILGGVGNIPASVLGGFALGLIENSAVYILPSGYKDVVSFSVLAIVLCLKPSGIAGLQRKKA